MDRQDNVPVSRDNPVEPRGQSSPRSAPGNAPVDHLQVIRISPELRAKVAEMRLQRNQQDSHTMATGSVNITLAVLALLFVVGTLLAFVTGLGDTMLRALPLAVRPTALLVVGVGVAVSVLWVIYALVRIFRDAEDYRERQV